MILAMTPLARPSIVHARLIVGLEIHIELATRSKMFTRTPNVAHPDNFAAAPNTLVDPVVAALPGSLPVMNRRAVEMSIMVGLALNCTIAARSKWDRKSYFYPDLPKGYQISQYDLPLCANGWFDLLLPTGETKRIGIVRAHLEEDTGKLGHELPGGIAFDGSLVDLNRAGTPLLEVVTEPDFQTAEEVVLFAQELRNLCRFLGVTAGIMQKAHLRFEPNVNLALTLADGREVRTPISEIKNLNSFRAVRGAIDYEVERQTKAWVETGREQGRGMKSTRGWDDVAMVTVLQREKEDAHDYRYFPDPDLVPVEVDAAWLARVRAEMPELPASRRARYVAAGIGEKDLRQLMDLPALCVFFDASVEAAGGSAASVAVAKIVLNAGARRANERGVQVSDLGITPSQIAEIVAMRESGSISAQGADQLFGLACESPSTARELAASAGLLVSTDQGQLEAWVDAAIAANTQAAEDVRAGKMAAIGRIVGAVVKQAAGSVDGKTATAMILRRIGKQS
ncbi:MAG: Asp-tRNA(Asn)/Glu-tRNA(Gln) amidotransferase subunit GatB [Phycisphaerales bacterium]|nr:Asp-tRNA(Asn)/Glu-tRNA(Gln) amidotransferase subunit GatB [Phycisphaerales bacterium]